MKGRLWIGVMNWRLLIVVYGYTCAVGVYGKAFIEGRSIIILIDVISPDPN